MQAATDLDAVIAAHNQYLETLLKKALLDAGGAEKPGAAAQTGLQAHLHTILRHMLDLIGPVGRLNEAVGTHVLSFAYNYVLNVNMVKRCYCESACQFHHCVQLIVCLYLQSELHLSQTGS